MSVSAFLFHSLKVTEMNVIYCMSAVGILSVSLVALKKENVCNLQRNITIYVYATT